MALNVLDQVLTEKYAIYNSDCMEVLRKIPDGKIHLTVYSPPFGTPTGGLFHYSSSDRDVSNNPTFEMFMEHYKFIASEISRVTMSGRLSAVHCIDVPMGNSGRDAYLDFPGAIIAMNRDLGMEYAGRHCIWKEPLAVRLRTMQKNLAHQTLVADSSLCGLASADFLLLFRKRGENPVPIAHPTGLMEYWGEREIPARLMKYRGWTGPQTENRYSHWIWRQYASSFWDDIRIGRVLPFKKSKDENDEKHVHALQLDVIDRIVTLRSNPGETVLTPFMGVGSEVYSAVRLGRKGIGIELKPSYFKQSVKNVHAATLDELPVDQASLELGEDRVDWPIDELA